MDIRQSIALVETASSIDIAIEGKRLEKQVNDALEAFGNEKTRANLEAVWKARADQDAFRELHWPRKPQAPVQDDKEDYRGQHAAPTHDGGAPLFDVSNGAYPADFYTGRGREYASAGEATDHIALGMVLGLHNRPNAQIRIYRAIPKTLPSKINVGDWITIVRAYATAHGRDHLNGDFKIVSKTVFARDIFTDGNSLSEWGYDPQPRVILPGRVRRPITPE